MKKAEAVLGPMLKRLGIESGVRLQRIRRDLPDLFDISITAHMFPAAFSEGELLLNVDSPIWMQQLTFYRKEIIRKLAAYGVVDAKFRLGKIPRSKKAAPAEAGTRPLSADETSFIESAVSDISDDRLKNAIRKAARKSLASTLKR